MKKRILYLAGILAFFLSGPAFAQEPTTTWPYLFPAFESGAVAFQGANNKSYLLNIHLRRGQLHYLDEKRFIREANLLEVEGAEIGGKTYLNVGGEMMEVVSRSQNGCVVVEKLGDYDALLETGGAYGSSSVTSATRKLSSIETDRQINQYHMLLQNSRSEGDMLDIITKYYLFYQGNSVRADRREVEKRLPESRKAEWKAWLKANKIKWSQPESLQKVVDFLNPEP